MFLLRKKTGETEFLSAEKNSFFFSLSTLSWQEAICLGVKCSLFFVCVFFSDQTAWWQWPLDDHWSIIFCPRRQQVLGTVAGGWQPFLSDAVWGFFLVCVLSVPWLYDYCAGFTPVRLQSVSHTVVSLAFPVHSPTPVASSSSKTLIIRLHALSLLTESL